MNIEIFIISFILAFIATWWYKAVKRQSREIEDREEDRRLEQESRQRIINLYNERQKKPLLCKVCTKKKRKKTYFEGLACFHCPNCNNHGFMSIYNDGCTGCANLRRFGSLSGY